MLDKKSSTGDYTGRQLCYAVAFTSFPVCEEDYFPKNPLLATIKGITGHNPTMSVLMDKLISEGHIIKNG